MTRYFLPGASVEVRRSRMRHVFRVVLEQGRRFGVIDSIADGEAVAVWQESHRIRSGLVTTLTTGVIPAALAMGWSASRRVFRFLEAIEHGRRQQMPHPHWYLLNLAVNPARQAAGCGSALLRHGIHRADLAGLPCYLETSNSRNVGFYQKHGFRLLREDLIGGENGPRLWSFARPAVSSTA